MSPTFPSSGRSKADPDCYAATSRNFRFVLQNRSSVTIAAHHLFNLTAARREIMIIAKHEG